MSEAIKDEGGPAFPVPLDNRGNGMSLRDYFAAKAVQAIVISGGANSTFEGDLVDAKIAYRMEDAMIEARRQ